MGAAVEDIVANVASIVWRSTSVWLVGYAGPFRCRCLFPLALLTDTLGYARKFPGRALCGFCALDFDFQDCSLSDRHGRIGSSGARPLRVCKHCGRAALYRHACSFTKISQCILQVALLLW